MEKDFVPEHNKGNQLDLKIEESCKTVDEAVALFDRACNRLRHPETWKAMTGSLGASFETPLTSKLEVGDYIQIEIPGPGLTAGAGYDWAKVDAIEENMSSSADEIFGMKLMVCENPEHPEKGTAHFFASGATSTFIVERRGQQLTVSYHGRNEVPNIKNEEIGDKVRNVVVALGAMAGGSEIQWRAFLTGLLAPV
jgi:hypothetical protein